MIRIALKSYFACAWSALTYIFQGMPKDKPSYWANKLGFNDPSPELRLSWASYFEKPDFHHLKDLLVEWVKVWPQRAAKLLALFGCMLAGAGLAVGILIGGLLSWALGGCLSFSPSLRPAR